MHQSRRLYVGWLSDPTNTPDVGGAQLSTDFLRNHPAEDVLVEKLDITHPYVWPECDVYVVQNCTQMTEEGVDRLEGKIVHKVIRDMWVNGHPTVKARLMQMATTITFLSPGHEKAYQQTWGRIHQPTYLCPSPVALERFQPYALNLDRKGVLWLGPKYPHKGVMEAVAWAEKTKTHVDFYGPGPHQPKASRYATNHPQVPYEAVPELMGQYEAFLFIPPAFEPFGRTVLEAKAAGLRLLVNHNIGALWWMENAFTELLNVPEIFWRQVRLTYAEGQEKGRVRVDRNQPVSS